MVVSAPHGNGKTVLVAGGAGFLGSHLCALLIDMGYRVICLDNLHTGRLENVSSLQGCARFRFIKADVVTLPDLGEAVDQIYNLACPASPPHYQTDPIATMMTCVVGTKNLLDLAEREGAVFLQASTSEIYGDPEEHPQREDYLGHVNCTGPRACYDEGKRAAETLCFDFLRLGKVDARVARLFNTYGPRMRADDGRIVSNLITQAIDGQDLTIYGSGLQTRSFCYVSDLVEGLVRLMTLQDNPQGAVNLGNPGEFTILELAQKVVKTVGMARSLQFRELPVDDPKRRRPDIERAKRLLGWAPTIDLDEGLSRTVAWFATERNVLTA